MLYSPVSKRVGNWVRDFDERHSGIVWRDRAAILGLHAVASMARHHFNCCVPGCFNSFRNSPTLSFYRIPKDEGLRDTYKNILKNDALKLESDSTRICSVHFDGGKKLSRNHQPTKFPWTKTTEPRRPLIKTDDYQPRPRKRKSQSVASAAEMDANSLLTGAHLQEAVSDTDLTLDAPVNADKECQTNIELDELLKVRAELEDYKKEVSRLKNIIDNPKFDIEHYKDSPEDIAFYTGFPDYQAMMLCYNLLVESAKNLSYGHERVYVDMERQLGRPRNMTMFQEFILVMMRLRLGLFERDLAHRFSISVTSVSRITRTWLRFMRNEFEPLINIPSRDVLRLHMPGVYKACYPNLTVIVDCTEMEMEKPSALDAQSACYSSYKSKTTMKALLGITPTGVICFVSEFYPGSTSDKEITEQSGFLDKLEHGDQVMADKGFNCQDQLASVGATLVIPAFLKGSKQFSKSETDHNKKVATLRIHVERLMERIKNWHIFDHRIPISVAAVASDILFVVSGLSNFHAPLIN